MGFFDDAWDAVTETASDAWESGADLAEDAWDSVSGAPEDAWEWASETGEDAWEAATDAAEDAWKAVSEFAGDAWVELSEGAEDVYGTVGDFAKLSWRHATVLVEGVISELERVVEDAWEDLSMAVDRAWSALARAIDDAIGAFTGVAEAAWEKIQKGLTDALRAVTAGWEMTVEGISTLYESTLAMVEHVLMWVGDLVDSIAEAIILVGACLGGIVIHALAKLHNIAANSLLVNFPRALPEQFRSRLSGVFGEKSFDSVYYIDQAILAADWYSSDVAAMTFPGLVIGGVPLNYVVFWKAGFLETDSSDRSTMVHELVHVEQYRRFRNEQGFACAYGVGYVTAGYDYYKIPLEDEAYAFESAKARQIEDMF